ncbi:hypothetical protein KNO57_02620 [Latilactobacillus sakei]|uniref:hypothetical protein n=2 Tax=Latilactobacillus sakei TaxID=1599 RepID=UPI003A86940D
MKKQTATVTPTAISKSIRTRFFVLQMVVILVLGSVTAKIVSGFNPLMTDSEILNKTILMALGSTVVALIIWYVSYKLIAFQIKRQVMDKELEDRYTFNLSHAASSLSLHIVYFISIVVIVWLMMSAQSVRADLDGLNLFKTDQSTVKLVDQHSMKQINRFYKKTDKQSVQYLGSQQDRAYFKVDQATISLPLSKVQFNGQDQGKVKNPLKIETYQLKQPANKKYLKPTIYLSQKGLPTVPVTKMYQHYTPKSSETVQKLDIE